MILFPRKTVINTTPNTVNDSNDRLKEEKRSRHIRKHGKVINHDAVFNFITGGSL
jgi:hypothetical protein